MGLNVMAFVLLSVSEDNSAMHKSTRKARVSGEFTNPGDLRAFEISNKAGTQQAMPMHLTTVKPAISASNNGWFCIGAANTNK